MNRLINMRCVIFLLAMVTSLVGCQDPYFPDFTVEDQFPILVVEGFINASGPHTRYQLTRTVPIDQEAGSPDMENTRVNGARLSVEREDGQVYQNQYVDGEGAYVVVHPPLDASHRYRLRIAIDQNEYVSDFVEVKHSPDIGDVRWQENEHGVQVYVSTEDVNNQSHYYLWEFEETWRFATIYSSSVVFENGELRSRLHDEMITVCFYSENSSAINIATSTGLSRDVIHDHPIQSISASSEKLGIRYSMLVKQRVLSPESFLYWDNLKNNSENLGDIFGAMPVELRGNINNVQNPREPVIGMVEAAHISEKRIFIDRSELEEHRHARVENPFYAGCQLTDTLAAVEAVQILANRPDYLPVFGISRNPTSAFPTHYLLSTRRCVDCTVRGTLARPSFWEE